MEDGVLVIEEVSPGHHPKTSYTITDSVVRKTKFADVIFGKSSLYGNVLFLDKELQSASSDEAIYHEHLVHPLMNSLVNKLHKSILVVGGGEGATVREVLKWAPRLSKRFNNIDRVDWVDIDGELVTLCRKHLKWGQQSACNDSRVNFYAEDIFDFLKRTTRCYDAIIIDLPDPSEDKELHNPGYEADRVLECDLCDCDCDECTCSDEVVEDTKKTDNLYGAEFWKLIIEHLNPGGGIVSHIGPVSPGNPETYKTFSGYSIFEYHQRKNNIPNGYYYHTFIPSFQSEWGFWMSVPPTQSENFPIGLNIMNKKTQSYAFTWPDYWNIKSFY
jgi:spermidine synthase